MKNIDDTLTIPNIQISQYESELEQALMRHPHWKGGEKNIFMKRLTIVGLSLGVLLIIFMTYTSYSSHSGKSSITSKAYAQEVAEKSYHAVLNISEEELQKSLSAESFPEGGKRNEYLNWLRAELLFAQKAKDLKKVTYSEFAATYPQLTPVATGVPEKEEQYRKGTFLEYTNVRSEKVILGIGENYIPFLTVLPDKKDGLERLNDQQKREFKSELEKAGLNQKEITDPAVQEILKKY